MTRELIASVLVAVLRRHVAEAFSFLTEAFGDDVDTAHEYLATVATGDERNVWRYWAGEFDQTYGSSDPGSTSGATS